MAVYVDPLRSWGGSGKFHWKISCHMYADTIDELHAMAEKIGLKLKWFQDDPRLPHYDLHPARRRKALQLGVYIHTRGEMAAFMRARKLERELVESLSKSVEAFTTGELLSTATAVTADGILHGSVPNVATNSAWMSVNAGAITLEMLQDCFAQMEELRRQDEESRKHIAENMQVFWGAPFDVVCAAFRLANSHISPLHPKDFELYTQLTTEYLQGKINARAEQHST